MLKLSLKNYFKCLLHVFVPLGCIFLGLLFGAYTFFGVVSEQLAYVKEEIPKLLTGVEADFDELWSFVIGSARELSWKNPIQTVVMLLKGEWLTEKIATFLGMTTADAAQLLSSLQNVLQTVGGALKGGLAAFGVQVMLGVLLGYFVTNFFVRRSTVKRGFWKFVLVSLLDSFLSATLVAVTVYLLTLWSPGALISSVVSMFLYGFVSLLEAYVIHGRNEIPFKTVVNAKNCFLLQLAQTIIFAISAVIVLIIYLITNWLVALAIGLSVAIIALLVANVNAEAYVVSLTNVPEEE